MNFEEQKESHLTEINGRSTDDLKKELLNVDFSSIKLDSAKIHPEWKALMRFTQHKVTEELGPEFKLSKDLSNFSLYVFPSLSFDIVSSILIYNMAAFVLDDYLDKFPHENEKMIQKVRDKNFPGNGVNDKWWRLTIKVCKETMSETALNQLLGLYIYCVNKAVEVNKLFTGPIPLSDRDFLELRCVDSGAPHQFYLVLAGVGKILTDTLLKDANYLGLNKQVALQVSLINDLYSLRKEIRDEIYRYNYVSVKMTNHKISAQAAVNAIIQEIHEADRMARVYGNRILEKNDPQLSHYVHGMYEVMAGNHYWSTFCKRYNDL